MSFKCKDASEKKSPWSGKSLTDNSKGQTTDDVCRQLNSINKSKVKLF